MTITTTLRKIISAQGSLQELIAYKPKGKFGYDAAKLVNKCNAEAEEFNKARQVSIEAYGTLDETKGTYSFLTQASQKGIENDTNSLLDTEVQLEVSKFPFADVEKLDPTIGLWAGLDWAIDPPTT